MILKQIAESSIQTVFPVNYISPSPRRFASCPHCKKGWNRDITDVNNILKAKHEASMTSNRTSQNNFQNPLNFEAFVLSFLSVKSFITNDIAALPRST